MIVELFRRKKTNSNEILIATAFFTAPCKEVNPIELYKSEKGFETGRGMATCRTCGTKATFKMLFLSPKGEVEGFFGPVYFCEKDTPDINNVATMEHYYDTLYGKK